MLTNILFLYYIALRHVNMNYNLTKAQTNRYFIMFNPNWPYNYAWNIFISNVIGSLKMPLILFGSSITQFKWKNRLYVHRHWHPTSKKMLNFQEISTSFIASPPPIKQTNIFPAVVNRICRLFLFGYIFNLYYIFF